jgi:hypothetical protein
MAFRALTSGTPKPCPPLWAGDLRKTLPRVFLGVLGCVALDTTFGLVLSRRHAEAIASKAQLFLEHGLPTVIQPDDPNLTDLWFQAGAAVQLGVALGVLTGLLAAAAEAFLGILQRRWGQRILWLRFLLAPIYLPFLFSKEAPLLSLLCALLTSLAFRVPWIWDNEQTPSPRKGDPVRAGLFGLLFVLVGAGLVGFSPHRARDTLIDFSVGRSIVHFYYEHTPLAAHVIQPLRHLTQKVIVQSDKLPHPTVLPHGTLWIATSDPCAAKGASLILCAEPGECPCCHLSISGSAANGIRLLEKASQEIDPNRAVRRGVRTAVLWGLPALALLVATWLGSIAEDLWQRGRKERLPVLGGCLILAGFLLWTHLERTLVRLDPSRLQAYARSGCTHKRYLALTHFPDQVAEEDLERLASDPSLKVRHRAFVEIGRRGNQRFEHILKRGVEDPEPLVRAKAIAAMTRTSPQVALPALERILATDPSWYVRDNAFRASWAIQPSHKGVHKFP